MNCSFALLKQIIMQYSLTKNNLSELSLQSVYSHKHSNIATRFLNWCEAQESNRFLWLALSFFLQIGMILPLTAYSIIFFGGNSFLLWIIVCTVNIPTLVLNLAALPTKTTLPFLFFAWFTEAVVILYCLSNAMM